jgi:ribose transport system ATP-binding protein
MMSERYPAVETTQKPLIELRGVRKVFPGIVALDRVDFDVRGGEVHALLGANGAGKSTLIKIIAGLYHPDAGDIQFNGSGVAIPDTRTARNLGISVIYQDFALAPNLSVAENLFLGREFTTSVGLIDWRRTRAEARRLLDNLAIEIPVTAKVADLSTGRRQLIEIAKALSIDAKLLVLDEPTASLSRGEAEILFNLIRRLAVSGAGIVYVSHRLEEIAPLVDRVTVLRDGRSVGTYPVGLLDRAKVVQLITGHSMRAPAKRVHSTVAVGEPLLELRHLSRTGEFENISLSARGGEIVVLTGLVGAGRTELLETIFGARRPTNGEIRIAGRAVKFSTPREAIIGGVALLPEDRRGQGLAMLMSVSQNISLAALPRFVRHLFLDLKRELHEARRMINDLAIKVSSPFQQAALLSGGNQQKLVLSKWLSTDARIFLLDEPTQGVDVGAKEEIYRLIRAISASGKVVLVASSDLDEVLEIADRVFAVRHGRLVEEFNKASLDPARLVDAITHGRAA